MFRIAFASRYVFCSSARNNEITNIPVELFKTTSSLNSLFVHIVATFSFAHPIIYSILTSNSITTIPDDALNGTSIAELYLFSNPITQVYAEAFVSTSLSVANCLLGSAQCTDCLADCGLNSICTNSNGSVVCDCQTGYEWSATQHKCIGLSSWHQCGISSYFSLRRQLLRHHAVWWQFVVRRSAATQPQPHVHVQYGLHWQSILLQLHQCVFHDERLLVRFTSAMQISTPALGSLAVITRHARTCPRRQSRARAHAMPATCSTGMASASVCFSSLVYLRV